MKILSRLKNRCSTWHGLVGLLLISCQKHDSFQTRDFLIFGEITYQCSFDCIRLYRIDSYSLRIDDEVDALFKSEYLFQEMALHPDKRAIASSLPDLLPSMLIALQCDRLGEPSPRSSTALIVVLKRQGEVRKWLIDVNEDRLPLFVIPFKRAIQDLLRRL